MTLVCAVANHCTRVIATDHRHSKVGDGEVCLGFSDHGAKLVRVDDATWLSFGGYPRPVRAVLERLIDVRSAHAVWDAMVDARSLLLAPTDDTPAGDYFGELFIACERGVGRVSSHGIWEPARGVVHIGRPPGQRVDTAVERIIAEFERATDIRGDGDLVRRVAKLFADVAAASPFVSPVMELVIDNGRWLVGRSRVIAGMSDPELSAMLNAPKPPIADVRAAIRGLEPVPLVPPPATRQAPRPRGRTRRR
jgi:hypothetical protein